MKNILVIFGGTNNEHDISMNSAATIIRALSHHNIIPVYITKEGKWLLYDGKLDNLQNINWEKFGTPVVLSTDRTQKGLMRLVGDKFKLLCVDIVFPVLHGLYGEDGTIQGLCELAQIPYVGSGVLASAIGMDKSITKIIAKSLGIPCVKHILLTRYEFENGKRFLGKISRSIGYPCFVKPVCGGSSIGINKVTQKEDLKSAIEEALLYSSSVLIEKAIQGREINIAVLGDAHNAKTSEPGESLTDGMFFDYDLKYVNPAKLIIPDDLPEHIIINLKKYTLDIFKTMGCHGMARVDFFLEDEKIYFNEINTIPGLTSMSSYIKLWKASGVTIDMLVESLIEMARTSD